jgi:dihydropteroate synthase
VVAEVRDYLLQRAEDCVHAGIARRNLLLDPGFGFGKTVEHNLSLLNQLQSLVDCDYPVLVGLSRKSLIGKVLGREVDQRLAASLALATVAVRHGASIIRTHDVVETVDAVRICDMVMREAE